MATFTHKKPGAVLVSSRVEVTDGFLQAGEVVCEIEQPANSIIEQAYFRQIDAATLASGASVGLEVGTASSGNQIAADATDAIHDAASGATDIPANFILELNGGTGVTWNGAYSTGDAQAPAVPAGSAFTADERILYFTVVTSDHAVTTGGKYEWVANFRVFS